MFWLYGLCQAICPRGALSMRQDKEGFWQPVVDAAQCNGCGLCNSVCPEQAKAFSNNNSDEPECFAGWHKNQQIRHESSSGGVFSALAELVLERGGFVCGAAFDDQQNAKTYHHQSQR